MSVGTLLRSYGLTEQIVHDLGLHQRPTLNLCASFALDPNLISPEGDIVCRMVSEFLKAFDSA